MFLKTQFFCLLQYILDPLIFNHRHYGSLFGKLVSNTIIAEVISYRTWMHINFAKLS